MDKKRHFIIITSVVVAVLVLGGVFVAVLYRKFHAPSPTLNNTQTTSGSGEGGPQKVLMISVDGFPHNFMTKNLMPELWKAVVEERRGAFKPLISCFPTETILNHWSMATGRTPARHGIWTRYFWDYSINRALTMTMPDNFVWDREEPIWHFVQRKGKRAAVRFWVGSNCGKWLANGVTNVQYRKGHFEAKEAVVEHALEWLKSHDLVMTYTNLMDHAFHQYGRGDSRFTEEVRKIDVALALAVRQLPPDAHLLIVSDHGMAQVTNIIHLSDFLSPAILAKVNSGINGPVTPIYPKDRADTDAIVAELQHNIKARNLEQHVRAYKAQDAPAHYHIADYAKMHSDDQRIPPIFLETTTVGWTLNDNFPENHGWDPLAPEMAAVVIGVGPKFVNDNKDSLDDIKENTDLFGAICSLLDLKDDR